MAVPRKRRTEPVATRPVLVRRNGIIFETDVPVVESRFVAYFGEPTTDAAGLVLDAAGDVYLVNPDGTREQLDGGGGGTGVPVAMPDQFVVDTTTYPDPFSEGDFLSAAVFTPSGPTSAVMAVAEDGDAWPTWEMFSNPEFVWVVLGDGTADPLDRGASIGITNPPTDGGPFALVLGGGDAVMTIGVLDGADDISSVILFDSPVSFQGGLVVRVYPGSPQGNLAGTEGDVCFSPNGVIWSCLIAGAAPDAVWVPIATPAAQILTATLSLGPLGTVNATAPGSLTFKNVDGEASFYGAAALSVTSPPLLYGASVAILGDADLLFEGYFTALDEIDFGVTLYITDPTGTNTAVVSGGTSGSVDDGGFLRLAMGLGDFGDWSITGADITIVDGIPTTTAGGIYTTWVQSKGSWD